MNRVIKFRAWDQKNKIWLESVPSLERLLDNPDAEISHHDVDYEMGVYFYPKSPLGPTHNGRVIYQQFTGEVDCFNKELYEGDIVRFQISDNPEDIKFDLLQVVFAHGAFHLSSESNPYLHLIDVKHKDKLEVEWVGNIFEYSYLLK